MKTQFAVILDTFQVIYSQVYLLLRILIPKIFMLKLLIMVMLILRVFMLKLLMLAVFI